MVDLNSHGVVRKPDVVGVGGDVGIAAVEGAAGIVAETAAAAKGVAAFAEIAGCIWVGWAHKQSHFGAAAG